MNWQKFEKFSPKKLASVNVKMTRNLPWKASLPFTVFFFVCLFGFFWFLFFFYKNQRRKDGNDFETDTVSGFQNTSALQLRAKTYSALSFNRINFFNMANLFSLSRKAFAMCYCFREPIKTFFFDACQMTVKSRVLHWFPVPQTQRSHIICILLASFFWSVL